MPKYPHDAACGTSDLPAHTWDDRVAGETDKQREARHNAAAAVCVTCPVKDACNAARNEGGGVRAGVARPDRVPGWNLTESNSWLGWSRDDLELHGNEAGIRRHYREGTNLCVSCRGAQMRHDATEYAKGNYAA